MKIDADLLKDNIDFLSKNLDTSMWTKTDVINIRILADLIKVMTKLEIMKTNDQAKWRSWDGLY